MFEHTVEHQIPVPFAGSGAGTAPLTWGQQAIRADMQATGWTFNISGAHAFAKGTTIDDVAEQLHNFMCKYPTLRMRLGYDDQGEVCQVVSGSGEAALDVFDVADDADPAKLADEMWYTRLLTPFDLHQDWSMRMAAIRHHGVPLYRVWTLNHLVVDGAAMGFLMADIGRGDMVGRVVDDPRTVQMLDLGRFQQSPAGRKLSQRAMRYWETKLHAIPARTFGEPTHPDGRLGKRYWHGRSHSPAAYLATLAIAGRTNTDTSRVILALTAIAITRVTGVNPLLAKVIVSNRFRPGFAQAIGPLSQNSLVTIDAAGATVDEVVGRVRQASLVASMNAYYDPTDLTALTARLDRERGYPAQVTCRLNDRRVQHRRAAEEAARDCHVTAEQIEAARPESWVVWDGTVDEFNEQAFITVEDIADTVDLQVIFDMACFTEAEVEAILHGIEEVAVEAAFDPSVPTRVPATN